MKRSPREQAGDREFNPAIYKPLIGRAAFDERVNKGRLPIIMICGHQFFVDVRLGRLRPKDNFMTEGLDIRDGGSVDFGSGLRFFYYHIPTNTEVTIPRDITEYPKDTVLIGVPFADVLDPVGLARLYREPDTHYLDTEAPMRLYHVAKVFSLEQTEIAEWIKANRAALPAKEQLRLKALDKLRKKLNQKTKGKRIK